LDQAAARGAARRLEVATAAGLGGPNPPPLNCRMTATGPFALAGVLSVTRMSTDTPGYDELST